MGDQAKEDLVKFSREVRKELEEMTKLGLNVPEGAINRTEDLEEMEDYRYMRVSECADLLITLSSVS